jgi:DnaA N-terminal domain
MNRKQAKPQTSSEIATKYDAGFFMVKNEVAVEYVPLITAYGLMLYNIYAAIANREAGNKWFVSLPTLASFTLLNQDTILKYNWLLEVCGLIRIKSGNDSYANEYTILKPEPITPEILQTISDRLNQKVEGEGKNWREFKLRALKRVAAWCKLSDCSQKRQGTSILRQQDGVKSPNITMNGSKPAPVASPDEPVLPTHDELVARLVRGFADAEPPLTEAAAIKMIEQYGIKAVKQQCDWVNYRVTDNPLRTLRAALKGNWSEPKPVGKPEPSVFTKEELEYILARQRMQEEAIGPEIPLPDSLPVPISEPVETGHALSLPPDPTMWQEVKERLRMQLTQATFDSWIRPTELVSMEGNQWVIQCASSFAQEWLVNRLNGTLTRTVNSVAGQAVELKFVHG